MTLRGIYGGTVLLSFVRIKAYIEKKKTFASITNASLRHYYCKSFLITESWYSFLNLDTSKNCEECL